MEETIELKLHDGEYIARTRITQEKKEAIVDRILIYCIKNDCVNGETLHQNDNCIIDATVVLSDILDKILDFETEWIDD